MAAVGLQVLSPPQTAMMGSTMPGCYIGQQYVQPQLVMPQHLLMAQPQQFVAVGGMAGWPGAVGLVSQDYSPQHYAQQAQQAQFHNEYDPVSSFLQQLGVDPAEEQYFGWIAELALQTPLPTRWESCQDPNTGCTYYVDLDTSTSSWENPLLPHLQQVVAIGREFLLNPTDESFFDDAKLRLWTEQKDELERWHGPFNNMTGEQYYVNSSSGTASARDPRTDAQYVYELQSSFLSSLSEVLCPRPDSPATPGEHWPGSLDETGLDGDVWRTATGAEVLTLDSADASVKSSNTERALRRLAALKANARVDHRSTLQEMSATYSWLRTAWAEEEEVQRLKLRKMAKLRARQRRKAAARKPTVEPFSLAKVPLPPAPPMEGSLSADGPRPESPMRDRPSPMPLVWDDDEPFSLTTGSISSALASLVLPPAGRPSPANLVRPPPSALQMSQVGSGAAVQMSGLASAAEATQDDVPLPPVNIPASPSLHRRSPGQKWAAEGFLAKAVAKGSDGGAAPLPPLPPRQTPPELAE